MKTTLAIVFSLLLFVGCGAVAAQTNIAPQAGSRATNDGLRGLPLMFGACPPGTTRGRCKTLVNDTSYALVMARIDNVPIPIFPYGGRLPLPRLLPGEKTQFVLPSCTNFDKYGNCVYVLVADLYEITDSTIDPQLMGPELSVIPVITEDTRHCYLVEFTVPRDGRAFDWPVSIQWVNNRPCPNKFVPKGTEKVADNQ